MPGGELQLSYYGEEDIILKELLLDKLGWMHGSFL